MRHRYECPLRWTDVDQQGRINNVVYADYLQEARVDLLRLHVGEPVDGLVVVSHQITYVAPLLFDFTPVLVETWVSEMRSGSFVLGYELYREVAGQRVVHLRAASVLAPFVLATGRPRRLTESEKAELSPYLEPSPAPRPEFTAPPGAAASYPLRVRFSDLDPYGHVNNVRHLEFFQEARVASVGRLRRQLDPSLQWVVAQAVVAYRRPILFRHEPYEVRTWIAGAGITSMVLEAEILDGRQQLAQARHVMVFVDPATGRAAAPPDHVREQLAASLAR